MLFRSPDEVAEALAIQAERIDAGGKIIPGNDIRSRLSAEVQAKIDELIGHDT